MVMMSNFSRDLSRDLSLCKIALRYPPEYSRSFLAWHFSFTCIMQTTRPGNRRIHHRAPGFAGHSLASDSSCVHQQDKAELKERRWRLARTSKSSHWSESTPSLKTELEADAHAAPPGSLPVSLNNHNDPRRHGLSPRFTWSWALMRACRSPAEHESSRTLYADRLRLSQAIIDQSGVGKILGPPPAS